MRWWCSGDVISGQKARGGREGGRGVPIRGYFTPQYGGLEALGLAGSCSAGEQETSVVGSSLAGTLHCLAVSGEVGRVAAWAPPRQVNKYVAASVQNHKRRATHTQSETMFRAWVEAEVATGMCRVYSLKKGGHHTRGTRNRFAADSQSRRNVRPEEPGIVALVLGLLGSTGYKINRSKKTVQSPSKI